MVPFWLGDTVDIKSSIPSPYGRDKELYYFLYYLEALIVDQDPTVSGALQKDDPCPNLFVSSPSLWRFLVAIL